MTKAELVDHVAAAVHLPKSQTDTVLTQCFQAIMDALQAGESGALRGFGRFQLRHRKPRAGRNPRTGETVQIPATAVLTFTAGKAFQERVQPSGCGWRRMMPTLGVAMARRQGTCTFRTAVTRAVESIPGGQYRCPLRCLPREYRPARATSA